MKFYAYCVTDAVPRIAGELLGLGGQKLETLQGGKLAVIASRFEGDVVPVTRQNVLQHELVVRDVFSMMHLLPFRFGTLVMRPALESYLMTRETALMERLAKVRDCVEMSVKVIWQHTDDAAPPAKAAASDFDQLGPGTAFLMFKRNELLGDEKLDEEARELKSWLANGLNGFVREGRVTLEPRQRLVISASYLVERARLPDYRRQLAQLQGERRALHFLTSGPWPPYTFANIDLEFQTHFGVS